MKKSRIILLFLLVFSFAVIMPLNAQDEPESGRDPVFEQAILDKLEEINPNAVPLFVEATLALDNSDFGLAKQGYEAVLELAPDFPDALRRLSYLAVVSGDVEGGLVLAREALEIEDSPYNQKAVARILLESEDQDSLEEALWLAMSAQEALPEDPDANLLLVFAASANDNEPFLRLGVEAFVRTAPEEPLAHFYAGIIAAEDGKWQLAEQELLRSQELGMPPEMVQAALEDTVYSHNRQMTLLWRSLYALGIWLLGMVVLFLIGVILSRLTLRSVRRIERSGQFELSTGEKIVRFLYRLVILIASIYFYVSIPVLILLVLGTVAGIFYLFFIFGRIPLRIALIVGLIALYTLYAIVRSLFVRIKFEEPGRPLQRDEAPALWSLVEEVAQRVDTRPVDAIYITPSTEIAVTERGRILQKLRDKGDRYLILGLGALSEIKMGEFKAILAHEYGHFFNRDTAGGYLANQVQISIHQMAYGLASKGQARFYNPAWLFINGFYRIYVRITLGASRLQEILADRYATLAYGAKNFSDGLTYVVHQSLLFDMQVGVEVGEAIEQKRSIHNLYDLPDLPEGKTSASFEEQFQAAMEQ